MTGKRFLSVAGAGAAIAACAALVGGACTPARDERSDLASSYCQAYADYARRCDFAAAGACARATVRDCWKSASLLSTPWLQAGPSCFETEACSAGGASYGTCLVNAVANTPPTSAQRDVVASYCARCAADVDASVAGCEAMLLPGVAGLFGRLSDDALRDLYAHCISLLDGGPDRCSLVIWCTELADLPGTSSPECEPDAGAD